VKFKPGMLQSRILFASQRFKSTHHEFCDLAGRTLAAGLGAECKIKFQYSPNKESLPGSQWQSLMGKFKNKPSQLLALVLQSELHNAAFADWKHSYTVKQIVKQLTIIDSAKSSSSFTVDAVGASPP
jgi:hypothetical protein